MCVSARVRQFPSTLQMAAIIPLLRPLLNRVAVVLQMLAVESADNASFQR